MLSALESEASLDAYLAAFGAGVLPKAQFTHSGHVLVAAAWIHENPLTALDRLRLAIRQFNVAAGGQNTDTAGYHETLTRFWVVRIAETLSREKGRLDAVRDAVARYGPQSGLFRQYYSFDVLNSSPARREWVAPDLLG